MNIHKDYYAILQIDENIYQKLIKKKYRELAKKYHPDKGGNNQFWLNIQEAYNVLSDVNKRIFFDSQLHNTSLNHLPIELSLEPKHIIKRMPIEYSYFRNIECECCGSNKNCKFCLGTAIKSEEISLTFHETDKYPDGLTFTVSKGGNVDKYGRIEDLIVRMNYIYNNQWQYDKETNIFIYNVEFYSEDIENSFKEKGKFSIYIKDIGEFTWYSYSIEQLINSLQRFNNEILIDTSYQNLKIRIKIKIKNIKKYFDDLQNNLESISNI